MASSVSGLPNESASFNQIGGASFGYLAPAGDASGEASGSGEASASDEAADDAAQIITIIDPKVGGEPLDPEKTYLFASTDGNTAPEGLEPLLSTMEEAAVAMGEFLKSGEAVILPDVPTPDNRIVPMEKIPAGAVVYEVDISSEE